MGRHALQGRIAARLGPLLGDKGTLPGQASRAAGWTLANTMGTRAVTFGINVMLARMLGPHAFGAFAVALVALTAAQTFNELGVSLAIVRWDGDPAAIVPTVATISVAVSTLTCAACVLAAGPYATAMGAPGAADVVRVLAIAIAIDGFANTPSGLLQRRFQQARMVIALQAGVWCGLPVTVGLAWSGFGAMSLAIGQVCGALVVVIALAVFVPESLRFGFDRTRVGPLLRFGLPLAGANLLAFAVLSVDQLIVGHLLGPVALGLYVLALNIAGWPLTMLTRPVRSVTPAVFARLRRDPPALRATFLTAAAALAALALPVCLAIAGSAGPLIRVVYGRQWAPAAAALGALALLTAARILFELAYDYLVVLGRARFVFLLQLAWLLALIPALAAGTWAGGIRGAALAEATVAIAAVLPGYLTGLGRSGIRLRELGRRLLVPAGAAALAGLSAAAAARLIVSNATALALTCALTLAIVVSLSYRIRAQLTLLRAAPRTAGGVAAGSAEPAGVAAGNGVPGGGGPVGAEPGDAEPGDAEPLDVAAGSGGPVGGLAQAGGRP